MEKQIKMELMKSVDSIKSKIKKMKNNEHKLNLSLDKMLKPVTEPLKIIVNKQKPNQDHNLTMQSCASSVGSFESEFQNYYDTDLSSAESPKNEIKDNLEVSLDRNDICDIYDDNLNIPFGIRKQNKTYMMGNSEVIFSKIDSLDNETVFFVKIGDKSYNLTSGLKELLLRKKPDLNLVSSADKLVYKDILHHTNAHKRDFNPRGQIRGDKGIKYRKIIKPLFSETLIKYKKIKEKLGGNLPKLKKYKINTDIVYWDDPNELVERLKLLIASRDAGNTNHDNEILSIIEELKEANIIKE